MKTRVLSAVSFLVVGAAFAAAPADAQSLNGYTIALAITTDAGQQPTSLILKAAGAKLRVETDALQMLGMGGGGGGGGMAAGAYLLPQDSGKVALIVPAMSFGVTLDLASLGGGRGRARGAAGAGGGAGAPGIALPEVTDVTANVDDLGAGESILGHATHKYRIRSTYAINGAQQSDTSETWFATDLTGSDEAFARFYTTFGAAFSGRSSSKTVEDAVRAKMPKGFPLKIVTTSYAASGTTVTTILATEVAKTTFDPAEFEVPPSIQLMDAGNLMGRRGG